MPHVLEISLRIHAQAAESTTDTILFTITSIIVSLPRSGVESDHISLPRSVMRMCARKHDVEFVAISPLLFMLVFAQSTQLDRTVSERTHPLSAH